MCCFARNSCWLMLFDLLFIVSPVAQRPLNCSAASSKQQLCCSPYRLIASSPIAQSVGALRRPLNCSAASSKQFSAHPCHPWQFYSRVLLILIPSSRQIVLISLRSNDRFAYDWRESCLSCRYYQSFQLFWLQCQLVYISLKISVDPCHPWQFYSRVLLILIPSSRQDVDWRESCLSCRYYQSFQLFRLQCQLVYISLKISVDPCHPWQLYSHVLLILIPPSRQDVDWRESCLSCRYYQSFQLFRLQCQLVYISLKISVDPCYPWELFSLIPLKNRMFFRKTNKIYK